MARGASRRKQITEAFDGLCAAIGRALGAAEGRRDAAVRAHAHAMSELWLRADGLEAAGADPALRGLLTNPQLADPIARIEADRQAAFTPWLQTGPEQLARLLADAAPGTAGGWPREGVPDPVGTADGRGTVPGLWRIGDGRIGDRPPGGFPVGVPLLDEAHLQVHTTPDVRDAVESWLQDLLLRVLGYFRPGLVRLHLWDVGSVTGTLPGLYPLTRTGLLTVHDPTRLSQLLDELADRIRRVHTRVLADGHPSLRALADATGEPRTEPWVVAVLIGNRNSLREEDHRRLQRVARGGLACGIVLVLLDVPASLPAAVETVQVGDDGSAQTSMTGPHVRVRLAEPLPVAEVTDACHRIAAAYDDWRSRIATFQDLLPAPDDWCLASSADGLSAPIGFVEGDPVAMRLGDLSPHALIGGPSGSGKTNLLLILISSLAARYSPWEVEFYLLDFKEGVSFAQFAPGGEPPSWLPHARLIGVNVNTDREFGLALLQFLSDEMRRRATEAKRRGVSKLAELRAVDPGGYWPRIVAVIDEFQFLFAEMDAVGKAAVALLEDVARRGRSQGIHLVLASQDTSSIQAFWGRGAILEQFVLRIALPRARRVLVETNEAAVGLPRWHAVLNHESGTKHGNEIVRIPDASAPGLVEQAVQQRLYDHYVGGYGWAAPRVFDGNRTPTIGDLLASVTPDPGPPRSVVGLRIDVHGQPATVPLTPAPGRNVGVLAALGTDAVPVLETAVASVVGGRAPGTLECVIAPLVHEAEPAVARLADHAGAADQQVTRVPLTELGDRLVELAGRVEKRLTDGDRSPVLVVLFAADAAEGLLDRGGTEALRTLLHRGPETGIHVLGWWRSVQRLRGLLTMGAAPDDLGALVALDVRGADLGPLVPGMTVGWSPRPGRGLFFDRAQHSQPEVIIVPNRMDP